MFGSKFVSIFQKIRLMKLVSFVFGPHSHSPRSATTIATTRGVATAAGGSSIPFFASVVGTSGSTTGTAATGTATQAAIAGSSAVASKATTVAGTKTAVSSVAGARAASSAGTIGVARAGSAVLGAGIIGGENIAESSSATSMLSGSGMLESLTGTATGTSVGDAVAATGAGEALSGIAGEIGAMTTDALASAGDAIGTMTTDALAGAGDAIGTATSDAIAGAGDAMLTAAGDAAMGTVTTVGGWSLFLGGSAVAISGELIFALLLIIIAAVQARASKSQEAAIEDNAVNQEMGDLSTTGNATSAYLGDEVMLSDVNAAMINNEINGIAGEVEQVMIEDITNASVAGFDETISGDSFRIDSSSQDENPDPDAHRLSHL